MKRRIFMQTAIAAIGGALGLSAKGQAAVVADQTDPEPTWESLQSPAHGP